MKIGVLALQGAFLEHEKMLEALNVDYFEIRQLKDLNQEFDGLIIPGGESTVQGKLLKELGMFDIIRKKIADGMPVYGTCAGLILLADKIANDDRAHLQTMNIVAKRNAYGRQLGSFSVMATFADKGEVPMVFIRAPYVESAGDNVEILAVVEDKIVAARQENQLVTAFHPELTEDLTVHKYFIDMVAK
ncbi:MAG: pyridoxal 5'-phosphate synthase glutaminase subunit PdxT [Eubacteriales bacterium]|nr:pyridoxal 5'-phosphate synthase glutaminase subunit PdxT [Eubacteriales bacterium]MDY3332556.1 pyridoxal 5'-phosphate synthase glutaminase subunit PdxT [Gallibacter sp.]